MVICAEGMYGPLTDILHQAGQQIGVTIQYQPPGGSLLITLQHSDVWVNPLLSGSWNIQVAVQGLSASVVRHCSPVTAASHRGGYDLTPALAHHRPGL